MKEEVFKHLFCEGAIRSFKLVVEDDGLVSLTYLTGSGANGIIYTQRGVVKKYRVATALSFLRSMGASVAQIDMKGWTVGQQRLV
jgi:hypothetical protein